MKLNKKASKLFARHETDFSIPLIAAQLRVYVGDAFTVKDNLDHCWAVLFEKATPLGVNFHICRTRTIKTVDRKLNKVYNDNVPRGLAGLLYGYLTSTSMSSVVYRVQKIFRLVSSRYITPEVQADIDTIGHSKPASFEEGT